MPPRPRPVPRASPSAAGGRPGPAAWAESLRLHQAPRRCRHCCLSGDHRFGSKGLENQKTSWAPPCHCEESKRRGWGAPGLTGFSTSPLLPSESPTSGSHGAMSHDEEPHVTPPYLSALPVHAPLRPGSDSPGGHWVCVLRARCPPQAGQHGQEAGSQAGDTPRWKQVVGGRGNRSRHEGRTLSAEAWRHDGPSECRVGRVCL